MSISLIWSHANKYNSACWWVSHNPLFWKSKTHSVNDSIYDFDWVLLEIPVKTCSAEMLLTCPISFQSSISQKLFFIFGGTCSMFHFIMNSICTKSFMLVGCILFKFKLHTLYRLSCEISSEDSTLTIGCKTDR